MPKDCAYLAYWKNSKEAGGPSEVNQEENRDEGLEITRVGTFMKGPWLLLSEMRSQWRVPSRLL